MFPGSKVFLQIHRSKSSARTQKSTEGKPCGEHTFYIYRYSLLVKNDFVAKTALLQRVVLERDFFKGKTPTQRVRKENKL